MPPARYYIPEQGRWLTPDPAGKGAVHIDDPQTWNMYAYVRNNPTTRIDPSGLLDYVADLLKKKIKVHIDDHLPDKKQQDLKEKLDKALKNINENVSKLTDKQKAVVGNINSVDVDSAAKRSYIVEDKGAFTLSTRDVEASSTPYLGSDVGHDAYHIELFKEGGIALSRGNDAEKKAIGFQIDFGKRIGLSDTEVKYLQNYSDEIEQHSEYTNSPPQ